VISVLPTLTKSERQQILVEWNNTRSLYPNCCVHELFEAQARRFPESVAVADDLRQLSYQELNSRSNQLARHLQQRGVRPDVLVGISVDRSIDMVVPELKWQRLFKRIGFHLESFRRARAAKRLDYLRDLLEKRIVIWKLQIWKVLYQLLLYTTGDIPSRFRDFDSMEFYAMCHYHPGRCPARVVLISADLGVGAVYSDRRLGWGEVVSGELEIHSVPCGHSDLFREPHVKTLARSLDTCLADAHVRFTTSQV